MSTTGLVIGPLVGLLTMEFCELSHVLDGYVDNDPAGPLEVLEESTRHVWMAVMAQVCRGVAVVCRGVAVVYRGVTIRFLLASTPHLQSLRVIQQQSQEWGLNESVIHQ